MAKPKPTVESVMKECRKQMMAGLGSTRLSAAADQYLVEHHKISIAMQLNSGSNWASDKKRVLPTSKKLGRVMRELAAPKKLVLLWAAKAAHIAVRADPGCPTLGSGGYCDF